MTWLFSKWFCVKFLSVHLDPVKFYQCNICTWWQYRKLGVQCYSVSKILESYNKIKSFFLVAYHTRQELSWYFLNCVMGSEGTLMTPATWGTTPNAQPNHGGRVFWKKSFFTFFGAQKVHYFGFLGALIDFLDQHTFFGPKTNGFRGVRLLAILDLRQFL